MEQINEINQNPFENKEIFEHKHNSEIDELRSRFSNLSQLLGISFGEAGKEILLKQLLNTNNQNIL